MYEVYQHVHNNEIAVLEMYKVNFLNTNRTIKLRHQLNINGNSYLKRSLTHCLECRLYCFHSMFVFQCHCFCLCYHFQLLYCLSFVLL